MKNKFEKLFRMTLVMLLSGVMLVTPTVSCRSDPGNTGQTENTSAHTGNADTRQVTEPETEAGENKETGELTEETSDDGTETGTEAETEAETEVPEVEYELPGSWGKSISNAAFTQNRISANYTDGKRSGYHFENMNLSVDVSLKTGDNSGTGSWKNSSGKTYLTEGPTVFMEKTNGDFFSSKNSGEPLRPNIFRFGYYYYDLRLLDSNFGSDYDISNTVDIPITSKTFKNHDTSKVTVADGVATYTVTAGDPYVYTVNRKLFDADKCNAIRVTISTNGSGEGQLYFVAGTAGGHSEAQSIKLKLNNDGEFHTYVFFIDGVEDYTGKVGSLRFDTDGSVGSEIRIKDLQAVYAVNKSPSLTIDRTYHLYADKLNTVSHIVATDDESDISCIGAQVKIPCGTVEKLIVKDKNGLHTDIESADFRAAEYAAFDIKEAGIFGWILLPDETSGQMKIEKADNYYVLTQLRAPSGNKLSKGESFYIGQRIYTDETHSFDLFLAEAENERNPMADVEGSSYLGYDALRGAYTFKVDSVSFNEPYFNTWNRHYTADVSFVNQSNANRKVYVLTTSTSGCLENAVILDENNMMLPIQPEVAKNFKGENEEPVYDAGDTAYGEAIFPLTVLPMNSLSCTVINLYQNWGRTPLKQLSSIQYVAPYYHLSTGVTETSCIAPWYVHGKSLWTLPDFRSMSAPFWFEMTGEYYDNQPQHTHGGYQYFLQYTDADGKYSASEHMSDDISSAGPTYSSIDMNYVSDDGRIKATYTQTEMPQTDEHRVYYEMKYEVLEDITFKDFKSDFNFYSAYAYSGKYQTVGYLDESNRCVTSKTNPSSVPEFVRLGDSCPYIALYNYRENSHNGFIDNGNNVNLGCAIYRYGFVIGGQKYEGNLIMALADSGIRLTLDLGEVTLRKGDTMSIEMIISPWGSQLSEDDGNMRRIREDSCLNKLRIKETTGTDITKGFLPQVKSTDGKAVEFTLTGGNNNAAFRAYGFSELTTPVLYEKINGEWQVYTVNSTAAPDKKNNSHEYDGYSVYYDNDGTFSYAFVIGTDGSDRIFKVEAVK